jgi:CheY-like chemotaxis protein
LNGSTRSGSRGKASRSRVRDRQVNGRESVNVHEPAPDAAQAAVLAELAHAEKTRFWAAASHDLKQPLHALGLYTALLRKDPPETERRELIDHITSCVSSLTSLFDAILGVTHAESAHLHAKAASFPIQRVIDQVMIQLRPSAEAKGLTLRAVPSQVWIKADPAVVERILGNLLSNAIRYTEHGRILVGVRRRPGACELVVADTGVGLSSHDQNRIFDDFFQVNNPERQREKGYGLGLSTVHRLCAALDYDIQVQSSVGRGSLFAVTLPIDSPTQSEEQQEAVHTLEADLNVLFVEDDPLVRDAMNRMLRDWGVRVCMCTCGDEAMAVLSQEFDKHWHVLLDQQLADNETGLQVADRIRAVIGDGPIISLVTGEDDVAVDEGAAQRGITVLRKPLKPIRLRAMLQSQHMGQGVI